MVINNVIDPYEKQYMDILFNIMAKGYKQYNERTKVSTLRVPHAVITVDLEKEFPILKSKKVGWKTCLKEILWIMQSQSNNINDLDAHIWDEWADETGSIGKAYGFQVAKPVTMNGVTYKSQVDYVLSTLAKDSSDRRCVINLWDVDDLPNMNLVPCCFSSIWTIVDGKLNCMLNQRSADYLVGVPFNTTQYALLTILFARHLGLKPGRLTHCMADAHVYCYKSHIDGGNQMLANFNNYYYHMGSPDSVVSKIINSRHYIEFTSENTDFFEFKVEDIALKDYESFGTIKFDVAI